MTSYRTILRDDDDYLKMTDEFGRVGRVLQRVTERVITTCSSAYCRDRAARGLITQPE